MVKLPNEALIIIGWLAEEEKEIKRDKRISIAVLNQLISLGIVERSDKLVQVSDIHFTRLYKLTPYGLRLYGTLVNVLNLCCDS